MKQTLLQMTQDILSSMSSDEVNSIGDTTESLQVATMIRTKFYDMFGRVPLPDHEKLINLEPSIDVNMPILMYVPDNVERIDWLKYYDNNTIGINSPNGYQHSLNVDITSSGNGTSMVPPGYLDVNIIPVHDFLNIVTDFNPEATNVVTYTFDQGGTDTYTLYYKNDRPPQFCTVIANRFILFDSYDSAVDSTLQTSKTMSYGLVSAEFEMQDDFVPPLNDQQFPLLYNEVKNLAFFELKQQPHPLADREVRRGWSTVQKTKSVDNKPTYFDALPNYGRLGRGGWGQPSYFKLRGFDR